MYINICASHHEICNVLSECSCTKGHQFWKAAQRMSKTKIDQVRLYMLPSPSILLSRLALSFSKEPWIQKSHTGVINNMY